MKILHVAQIEDSKYSGVAIVVPNYLKYQSKHASVALLNIAAFTPPDSSVHYTTHRYDNEWLDNVMEDLGSIDIVIFHEVYRPAYAKISRELRKLNIPYIITPHVSLTKTAQKHKQVKKILGNTTIFRAFLKNATSIHYLSISEQEQSAAFKSIGSFICNNGIEIQGRVKNTLSKNGTRLIYIGRLKIGIKGIDRIIEAANIAQVEMRKNNISIALRGYDEDGSMPWIHDSINKYGISDIVEAGGPLFGQDKINALKNSDFFIQLSRTEGQPLGIMEAMDLGVPCIVTEGTTFRDAVYKNKLGLPAPDDISGISNVIVEAGKLSHASWQEMSIAASNYTKKTFDWPVISRGMIKAYKKALRQ